VNRAKWFALQQGDVEASLRQATLDRKTRRKLLQGGLQRSEYRILSEEAERVIMKWVNGVISGRMAWVQFCVAVELELDEGFTSNNNGQSSSAIIGSTAGNECQGKTKNCSPLPSLVGAPIAALQSMGHSLYNEVFSKSPQEVQEQAWLHVMLEADKDGTSDELILTLKRIALRAKAQGKEAYCKAQIWRMLLENMPSESASSSTVILSESDISLNGEDLIKSVNKLGAKEIQQQIDDIEIYLSQVVSYKRQFNSILQKLEHTNHYEVLGVSKDSSDEEVKRAFIKLARHHHPDKGGDADTFTNIHQAYQAILAQRGESVKLAQRPCTRSKSKSKDSSNTPRDDTSKEETDAVKSNDIQILALQVQKEAEVCSKVAVLGLQSASCISRASRLQPSLTYKTAKRAVEIATAVAKHTNFIGELLKVLAESSRTVSRFLREIVDKLRAMGDGAIAQSYSLKEVIETLQHTLETVQWAHSLQNSPPMGAKAGTKGDSSPFTGNQTEGILACVDKLSYAIRTCANAATDSAEAALEVASAVTRRSDKKDECESDSDNEQDNENNEKEGTEKDKDEKKSDQDNAERERRHETADTGNKQLVKKRLQLATLLRQADASLRMTQSKVWKLLSTHEGNLLDVDLPQKSFLFSLCAEMLDEGCVALDEEIRKPESKDDWLRIVMDVDSPLGFLQKLDSNREFVIHPDLRVQLLQLARVIDVHGLKSLLKQGFERVTQSLNWLAYRPVESEMTICITEHQMKTLEEFQNKLLDSLSNSP